MWTFRACGRQRCTDVGLRCSRHTDNLASPPSPTYEGQTSLRPEQGCSGAGTRGDGVPHFFGLKFVQKLVLVHCCNWLFTETQCKIISVQHVCRPELFKKSLSKSCFRRPPTSFLGVHAWSRNRFAVPSSVVHSLHGLLVGPSCCEQREMIAKCTAPMYNLRFQPGTQRDRSSSNSSSSIHTLVNRWVTATVGYPGYPGFQQPAGATVLSFPSISALSAI